MNRGRRILIAGGGIIGLCSAYYCLLKGHQVIVVERGGSRHDSCSLGNAGMIVPSHFTPLAAPGAVALGLKWMLDPASPFYIRPRLDWGLLDWGWKFYRSANAGHVARAAPLLRDLSLASRGLFQELAREFGDEFGLVEKGLVMLCKTQHALDEEAITAQKANQLGIPAQVLDSGGVAGLDPNLRSDVRGGVFFPQDCHLDPGKLVAALTRRLIASGAEIRYDTEVLGWHCDGAEVKHLKSSTGDLTADEYLIAAGSWSPQAARGLQLRLPMQPGKGYSLTLRRPRQLPLLCSILTEARVAVTPMGGALRFGGTMEMAGWDESIDPLRVKGIVQAVPRYFPDFKESDFEGIEVWRGLRPCSPDGLPYVGRVAAYRNLSVATGHAMMGLSLAPVTGVLVSEILSGEKPRLELGLLDPDRF